MFRQHIIATVIAIVIATETAAVELTPTLTNIFDQDKLGNLDVMVHITMQPDWLDTYVLLKPSKDCESNSSLDEKYPKLQRDIKSINDSRYLYCLFLDENNGLNIEDDSVYVLFESYYTFKRKIASVAGIENEEDRNKAFKKIRQSLLSHSSIDELKKQPSLKVIIHGLLLSMLPGYGLEEMDRLFAKVYQLRKNDPECVSCGQLAFYRHLIYAIRGKELLYTPFDDEETIAPLRDQNES